MRLLELTKPGHLKLTKPGHLKLTKPGHLKLTMTMSTGDHTRDGMARPSRRTPPVGRERFARQPGSAASDLPRGSSRPTKGCVAGFL